MFVVSNRDAYTQEAFARSYPEFNALAYSLDVFVPFVSFGYEDHWRPNIRWRPLAEVAVPNVAGLVERAMGGGGGGAVQWASLTVTIGGALYVLGVVEMLLGLVLTSLAVTGFTGLLRGDADDCQGDPEEQRRPDPGETRLEPVEQAIGVEDATAEKQNRFCNVIRRERGGGRRLGGLRF